MSRGRSNYRNGRSSVSFILKQKRNKPFEVCYHVNEKVTKNRKIPRRPPSKKPWVPPPGRATHVPPYQNWTNLWSPLSPPLATRTKKTYPIKLSLSRNDDNQPKHIIITKKRPGNTKVKRSTKMPRSLWLKSSPNDIECQTETVLYLDELPDSRKMGQDKEDNRTAMKKAEIKRLRKKLSVVTKELQQISSRFDELQNDFPQTTGYEVTRERTVIDPPFVPSTTKEMYEQRAKKVKKAANIASQMVHAFLKKRERPTPTDKLNSSNAVLANQMSQNTAWVQKILESIKENRMLAEKTHRSEVELRETCKKQAEETQNILSVINDMLVSVVNAFSALSDSIARETVSTPDLIEKTKMLKKMFKEFLGVLEPIKRQITYKDKEANDLLTHSQWIQKLHKDFVTDDETTKDALSLIHSNAEEIIKHISEKKRHNQKLKESIVDKTSELAKINVRALDYHLKAYPSQSGRSGQGRTRDASTTVSSFYEKSRRESVRNYPDQKNWLNDSLQKLEKSVYGLIPVLEKAIPSSGRTSPFDSTNKSRKTNLNQEFDKTRDSHRYRPRISRNNYADVSAAPLARHKRGFGESRQSLDLEDIVRDVSDRTLSLGKVAAKIQNKLERTTTGSDRRGTRDSWQLSDLESGPLSMLGVSQREPKRFINGQNISRRHREREISIDNNYKSRDSTFFAMTPHNSTNNSAINGRSQNSTNRSGPNGQQPTRKTNNEIPFQNTSALTRSFERTGEPPGLRKSRSFLDTQHQMITSTPKTATENRQLPKRALNYPSDEDVHPPIQHRLSRQRGSVDLSMHEDDISAVIKKMNRS